MVLSDLLCVEKKRAHLRLKKEVVVVEKGNAEEVKERRRWA